MIHGQTQSVTHFPKQPQPLSTVRLPNHSLQLMQLVGPFGHFHSCLQHFSLLIISLSLVCKWIHFAHHCNNAKCL